MTQPKVSTISRGGSRFYVHPHSQAKAPGVTSVLNMLPKPFLQYWAAKLVAEAAVDGVADLVGLAMRDRDGAIDYLKRAPGRFTKAAADVGTEAHGIFEDMARGRGPGRLTPEMKPFAAHYAEFLDEFQPEFLHLEDTVWSETYDYAGSFDAIARIGDEIIVLDNKTTRSGVHAEVAMQLAAYRFADYILQNGEKVDMPAITGGAVLHIRPEGWQLVPVRCDEEIFTHFLDLRRVFDWDNEVKRTVLGVPVGGSE